MAYIFLDLVNDVNRRLNENVLNSANFASAAGYSADVKGYVSAAINRINREEFEWPFNHVKQTLVLTEDQSNYPYPTDAKSIAFDTFRVKGETSLGNSTRSLKVLDYEEYLQKMGDYEFNPSENSDVPSYIVRNRDLSFTVAPPPDKAYELTYEYYKFPPDLDNWDDVPTIPEQFRWVILEGAMYYAYMFRGGTEEASISNQLFQAGIKDLRKLYVNRYEYARSTMTVR